ncbi:MAG: hypothetical protein N3H31_07225 [Candidatus Nezhaarchaeota archaeon]|nr:hypothetical protein [Candidatus Nezhaarchaeota archaeon]
MIKTLYIVLAIVFATPIVCLVLLATVGKKGLRGAASSLKLEIASVMLLTPFVTYCVVGMYLNLPTTHFALAAFCLAMLALAILALRKAAGK